MTTSKAAVFVGAGKPLEVQEFPVPDPPPGGAIVKMSMAAVCGTDVHNLHIDTTPHPMIFGHENVATLAMAGQGLDKDVLGQPLREGDRVLFRSAPCGKCRSCAMAENCEERMMYGMRPFTEPPHITGGFSQYVYLEPTRRWILKIPDDVTSERALISVTGNPTYWRGIQRMGGIGLADTVVVQGSGPMGMAGLVQAKTAGAGRVIMIGAPSHRLEMALELGASETLDLQDFPTPEARVQRIQDITNGRGADVVIECAGTSPSFRRGWRWSAPWPVSVGWLSHGLWRGAHQSSSYRAEGAAGNRRVRSRPGVIYPLPEAMQTMTPYPVERMVSHKYGLDQANEAFRASETLEAMVAVITPNG